jgi:hypothetical protein
LDRRGHDWIEEDRAGQGRLGQEVKAGQGGVYSIFDGLDRIVKYCIKEFMTTGQDRTG